MDVKKGGIEYTDLQKQALAAIYSPTSGLSEDFYLGELYVECATQGDGIVGNYIVSSDADIKRLNAALILCPDHPQAAAIQTGIAQYQRTQQIMASASEAITSAQAAEATRSQAVAEGVYAESGKHLIGTEILPGTWQSVDEKVEDCYWELSNSTGEIIDNNFISVAPQFTIVIPTDAAGFTNTGCAFQRIGD